MILLLMVFTVSEIALPIWQGRGRLVLQGHDFASDVVSEIALPVCQVRG
jgi:hypothetical protein